MASNDFESWLNERLCKFLNNDDSDTSVFLNYIISLLNEEDTSIDDKKNSIEPILQDLDPVIFSRYFLILLYFWSVCFSSQN